MAEREHEDMGASRNLLSPSAYGSTMTDLTTALARLKGFRERWNDTDLVDEESGLTAADLDALIAHLDMTKDQVFIERHPLSR